MPDRKMFWRIIHRIFVSNRARLLVILLALGAGATVTAALLNLQIDAKRRLTTEFRAFGPNVILSGQQSEQTSSRQTLPETVLDNLPASHPSMSGVGFLYATVHAAAFSNEKALWSGDVIAAGYRYFGTDDLAHLTPYRTVAGGNTAILDVETCDIGERVATQSHVHIGDLFRLKAQGADFDCIVAEVRSFGSAEDDEILIPMAAAQRLAGRPKQISLVQLSVPGTPPQIEASIAEMRRQFPNTDVRPIRQFTEGEAKIYNRISGILSATVALVLVLTALCVMAAMTNVAMERRNDVGLMKAIGGATRRVLRLFLAEAALLGLTGGVLGAALGIVLSMWLGKAVFGVAARPRLIVYPVSVALTIIVAIAGAYPLRRLANIRPASVFRGEA